MAFDTEAYTSYLEGLYRKQLAHAGSRYVESHSTARVALLRQVQTARLYLPYVRGRVLDWGCHHAPDACLVRKHWGDQVELHGCDIYPPDTDCLRVFHEAAGLCYRRVDHPYAIPFDDGFFDTVIAAGVLEHVPNDGESLKELYRVLKPDGLLVVSFLPNAWSHIENIASWFRLPHHPRAYTMGQAHQLLLHSGFQPFCSRYLQMTPSLAGLSVVTRARWLRWLAALSWKVNPVLERLWPINRLASNLFLMARKRIVLQWDPDRLRQERLLQAA